VKHICMMPRGRDLDSTSVNNPPSARHAPRANPVVLLCVLCVRRKWPRLRFADTHNPKC
jgi:hypothetical protein